MKKITFLFTLLFACMTNSLMAEIQTNTLPEGNYYIKISDGSGGYLYLTHTGDYPQGSGANKYTTALTFSAFIADDVTASQIFAVTKDGEEYKITCNMNGTESYMQENLYFQSDMSRYASSWNSHRIFYDTDKGVYAGRPIGSDVTNKGPWTVDGNNQFVPDGTTVKDPEDANYLFYFEEVAAIPVIKVGLQTAIDNAETLKTAVGTNLGIDLGQYGQDEYDELETKLAAANTVNGKSDATQDEVDIAASDLNNAITALKNSYKIETNLLPTGEYYVYISNQYYVNNPGDLPVPGEPADRITTISVEKNTLSTERNILEANQIVTVTAEANGRYTFFSALYEENVSNSGPNVNYRNINESPDFRTDYSGDGEWPWRTMNIYYNGTAYAIKTDENEIAKGYWNLTDDKLIYSGDQINPHYIFNLIAVKDVFSDEIAAGRTRFDAAVKGEADGQYKEEVYNAFKAALEAAEGIDLYAFTKEDLFEYAAAAALFVPNDGTTGMSVSSVTGTTVAGTTGAIVVNSENTTNVAVYSVTGQLQQEVKVAAGKTIIPVNAGIYIVKTTDAVSKVVVK